MGYKYAVNENFAVFGNAGPYVAIGLFGKVKQMESNHQTLLIMFLMKMVVA